MTVSDNIFVLRQGFRQNIIKNRLLQRQLAPFMKDIGVQIPADAYVDKLSAFERVTVELLRAVVAGYRLIVLHEIGTVINGEELTKLYEILQHYAGQGFSFLYISLHHEEIMEVCDRVALFSNGRIQKVAQRAEMKSEIVRSYTIEFDKMVRYHMGHRNAAVQNRKAVLSLSHIAGDVLTDFAMDVYEGECLVVQTLDEQVFRDILSVLCGDRSPHEGKIRMEGRPVHPASCKDLALIAADPTKTMVFQGMSYLDNLCMGLARRVPGIWQNARMKNSVRKEYAESLGEDVFSMPVEALGEKQKYQLVYTRALLQKPKVVVCVQPFRGADLTHRIFIWKMMEMLLDKGMSVVILTINLADSMSLADRLIRVSKEGIVQEVEKEAFGSLSLAAPWIELYR